VEESEPLLQQAWLAHFEQPVPQHFLAAGCADEFSPDTPNDMPCHARKIPSSSSANDVLAGLVAIYIGTVAEVNGGINRFEAVRKTR